MKLYLGFRKKNMAEMGEGKPKYPNNWPVLPDKGYQDVLESVKAVLQEESPQNTSLPG